MTLRRNSVDFLLPATFRSSSESLTSPGMCCLLLDLFARFLAVTGGVLEATDDPEDPEPLGLGPDVLPDHETGPKLVHVIAHHPSDFFKHHPSFRSAQESLLVSSLSSPIEPKPSNSAHMVAGILLRLLQPLEAEKLE